MRWIFDVYSCISEFIERIFVVAYHYEDAVEAIEAYLKRKQDCWVNYVGEEQVRDDELDDDDPSSDLRS